MKFALIGVGYVAAKHFKAIKETGNELVAVLNNSDSVGILDSWFPACNLFTDLIHFDRWLTNNPVDYISICTPSYSHDFYIRLALSKGAKVICEKPLVLNTRNISFDKDVFTILQLRLHPEIQYVKKYHINSDGYYKVTLDYNSFRGSWYNYSWKGDDSKSGGIITNIGIHLFDILIYLFGEVKHWSQTTEYRNANGSIQFENAEVVWSLSIDKPKKRLLTINEYVISLDEGFEDLHTKCYEQIFLGNGVTVEDALPSLRLVEQMRG